MCHENARLTAGIKEIIIVHHHRINVLEEADATDLTANIIANLIIGDLHCATINRHAHAMCPLMRYVCSLSATIVSCQSWQPCWIWFLIGRQNTKNSWRC